MVLTSMEWFTQPENFEKIQQGLSAYVPLDDAFISIAARIYLIRAAKKQINLQYYIWQNDFIGQLMLYELLKAADRGVKIRLLIDDQNGTQLDEVFKGLLHHDHFEIKAFNPYKFRKFRVLDYIFRLKKMNRRMHNKLITADAHVAVTGGRNISCEYFEASEQFQFTDLDILFFGNTVKQADLVFENFWEHSLSISVEQLIGLGTKKHLALLRDKFSQIDTFDTTTELKIKAAEQELSEKLQQQYSVQWAKAHFVADSPKKVQGKATNNELIYNQMFKIMGQPQKQLELVSAYFVPTGTGTDYLNYLNQNGLKTRILTNSFAANDVAIVHAFYSQYREKLLKNGNQLYEFKPNIERKNATWYEKITGRVIPAKGKKRSSLHAKFFDVDGKVFIGSFNFDPRSANLNTEVGLVVESDDLQDKISAALDQYLPIVAYELKLDADGNIIWLDYQENGQIVVYSHDPETSKFQRVVMKIMAYLPIEKFM